MQISKFEEKVKQHAEELKKHEAVSAVDWDKRKVLWQKRVTQLLDDIQGWLAPLIQDNTVTFTRKKVSITEYALGTYDI